MRKLDLEKMENIYAGAAGAEIGCGIGVGLMLGGAFLFGAVVATMFCLTSDTQR